MEDFERYFYQILEEGYNEDSTYDYLVLFSGGKDSTYIAHKLKAAKGKRICLFTVDNGFEKSDYIDKVKKNADLLGCDLFIYKPRNHFFKEYYRYLITEPALRSMDKNPVCYFCGRQFMSMGVEFAERNSIPFVFYGATPEQINEGSVPSSLREIQLFDMVTRKYMNGFREKVKKTGEYQNNEAVREMMDRVFYSSKKVNLIFPFQFIEYHINNIKKTLEKEYGWQNPVDNLPNERYLSSGCDIINLFGVFEKRLNFKTKELNQFKKDFEKGMLSKEAYDHTKEEFETILKGEITEDVQAIAENLNVKDFLLDKK